MKPSKKVPSDALIRFNSVSLDILALDIITIINIPLKRTHVAINNDNHSPIVIIFSLLCLLYISKNSSYP